MWNCFRCNEDIEDSLDICWNCGTTKEGEADPSFQSADEMSALDTSESASFHSPRTAAPATLPIVKWNRKVFFAACAFFLCLSVVLIWFMRPKTALDFYELGLFHLQRNEYPESIKAMSRSLERLEMETKKSISARKIYTARALAYNNLGDYENTFEDSSRAIDLIPPAMNDLPVIFITDESQARLLPEGSIDNIYLMRANALIGLGKNERAIADLNLVLKNDSTNKHARDLLRIAQQRN